MTRSLPESLSKVQGRESLIFPTYVAFSTNFPNICNDYLLANVIDSFLLLFWQTKAISPVLWILFLTKYDKMSSHLLKKRFWVKDRGSNETLGKIEADF